MYINSQMSLQYLAVLLNFIHIHYEKKRNCTYPEGLKTVMVGLTSSNIHCLVYLLNLDYTLLF